MSVLSNLKLVAVKKPRNMRGLIYLAPPFPRKMQPSYDDKVCN